MTVGQQISGCGIMEISMWNSGAIAVDGGLQRSMDEVKAVNKHRENEQKSVPQRRWTDSRFVLVRKSAYCRSFSKTEAFHRLNDVHDTDVFFL